MERANLVRCGALVVGLCSVPLCTAWGAQVPKGASDVYVQGTQLMVSKRQWDGTLGPAQPYLMKGVTWSPATRAPAQGPNPLQPALSVPYGFFFDWPGQNPQGHVVLEFWLRAQFAAHDLSDLPLLASMGANTVRVYTDLSNDPATALQILDHCYEQGLMVILTVAGSKTDLQAGLHIQRVTQYKDHPAILMWSLGNEWNFNSYYGYASIQQAIDVTQMAAQQIKALDSHHPVSSVLGDRFTLPPVCDPGDPCCGPVEANTTVPAIVSAVSAVDIWGLNVYRGSSFGQLFAQWSAITPRPFYLSEFGTDSFGSQSYQLVSCGLADAVSGGDDQPSQAALLSSLWQELAQHLSSVNLVEQAVGGLVHTFNDELWKVGSYHVGLGGLVPYDGPDGIPGTADDDTSYDEYNADGFVLGAHPDGVANEEYFGLVDADRAPKQAFTTLQGISQALPPPLLSPIGSHTVNENARLTFTVSATDQGGDPLIYTADNLPAGATFSAARLTFSWTPSFQQAGSYTVLFSVSDGTFTDTETVSITVTDVNRAPVVGAVTPRVRRVLP